MNFAEFCTGSFFSVPMNFWVCLSIPSTGGRDLAPYCKKWKNKIFFRGRKFWSKLHFSHFECRFFIIFSSMLRKFWVSGARWGRILPESEERIEKCVDTAENEPRQKWENFDAFSNKKTRQNLFFSKLNFFDADRAENWHSFNWDVVEWPQQFSARSVTMCVENLKFDSFLFTY